MKKSSFELLDNGYINLYEEWIFVRCFEYSAVLLSQLTWYRLFANIDKKSWFVFLEVWFPKNKLDEIVWNLENRWYSYRIIDKNWKLNCTIWKEKLQRNQEILKQRKNNLINF